MKTLVIEHNVTYAEAHWFERLLVTDEQPEGPLDSVVILHVIL